MSSVFKFLKVFSFAALSATLFFSCKSSSQEGIAYTLSWKGDGIGVEMNVETSEDTLMCTFGQYGLGGQTDQLSWLQDLDVTKGNVIVDSSNSSLGIIPVSGKAKLSYTVRCTLPKDYYSPNSCAKDDFRPDIDSVMLYSHGVNIFVLPTDGDVPVSVDWQSKPDYPVFCLYNPGVGTDHFEGEASELGWTLIVGDPLLDVDSVMVDGHLNYLVTALRYNKEDNKNQVKEYFRNFYSSISAFWQEEYTEPYSLVLFPFRSNTFDVTGNGFDNGFMSRYDATAEYILNDERRDLFTHEIGHKWVGNGPEWFTEGFNEMQTGYQIVASGLDDPSYFATYLNTALTGLYHNPHRNEPDSVAEESFWNDGQYVWLLYWRGFSYAFYLTGQIEKETGHANAYKDMMMALKKDIHDMTQEAFLEDMSTILPKDKLESDFKKYILDGEDIVYTEDNLPSGCRIQTLPDGSPSLVITDMEIFRKHFE